MRCKYKKSCTNKSETYLRQDDGSLQPVCGPCNIENDKALKDIMKGILSRKFA